ncbi:MAG TPA: phytanoyl-CoA dioxygenase family protein [Gemmatimonadota bacterium]|nr:phytanoyl-CoA dioxygenase family protein [Gemmatimonadota bacterium]
MSGRTPSDEGRVAEAMRRYHEEGFAVLPSVFAPGEVDRWKQECDRLAGVIAGIDPADSRIQSRGHRQEVTVRDRYDPVTDFSPLFRTLASDPRLETIAERVLGGAPVRFKDRLILKSSGTTGYGLHQDWPYWEFLGIPPDEFASLLLSVDGTDATNGAIEVFPGLHRSELPAAADEPRDLDPSAVEGHPARLAATKAGDVLLLHPMAPHRSGPNLSGGSRRILTYMFTLSRHADAGSRYYAAIPSGG